MTDPAAASASERFAPALQRGERLLWRGEPQPRPRFGAANGAVQVFAAAAGLALVVIAITLCIAALSDAARLWLALLALALAGYCAALFAEARSSDRAISNGRAFAVTDRRVLCYSPDVQPPFGALSLNERSPTKLVVHRDDSGTEAIGDREDVLAPWSYGS